MNLLELLQHPYLEWFIAFGVVVLIQLLFYWLVFSRVAFAHIIRIEAESYPPVSVVISARDEYKNLKAFLPSVLTQNYPDFEVVVVNHLSEDDSQYLLRDFQRQYSHLKVVTLNKNANFFHGKKFPLSIGIKEAQHEILLLTDADCKPVSSDWIRSMVSAYGPRTEIVLGYSNFMPSKGFLNLIQRFEAFHTAMLYLSLAKAGLPYMGIGRNLSYKRSLFFRQKGFISHYTLASGDDDLFINQAACSGNTSVNLHPDSFIVTRAKNSWGDWFRQKRRHYTTGSHYRFWHKTVLGLYSSTQFLFYILFAVLLLIRFPWWAVVSLAGVRFLSQWLIWGLANKKLKSGRFVVISPLLEIIWFIITGWILATKPIVKETQWK
ncbi:MAG: glycosyltransferase [Bacteroidales bacterium]